MNAVPVDEQVAILMRGAEYGDPQIRERMLAELRQRLLDAQSCGRPLRVYCGYDPTAPDIHLGHTVTMRKLRQFQELGHHIIFLIGTFTGLIGDPSDKDRARPRRPAEQLAENARTYAQQAFCILDESQTEVLYNAEWLSKLSFEDVIGLSANFTVQQFLARDNFAKRFGSGDPIWLHEFFYALMQGYDAVAMQTDVQIGGTDQLFGDPRHAHIRLNGPYLAATAPNLVNQLQCLTLPLAVVYHQPESVLRQTHGDGAADPPRSAGYNCHLSLRTHSFLLRIISLVKD